MPKEHRYPEVEARLRPLVKPLDTPQAGDWLTEHPERGQTFRRYMRGNPVRRSSRLNTIYFASLGEFTEAQEKIFNLTREYFSLFFDAPVKHRHHILLSEIPVHATRRHPRWCDQQVLTSFVLEKILEPDRPDDALAYLAVTGHDLWPGRGWNFLFGEADFRKRVGVTSMYRNGSPDEPGGKYLWRTLAIASHETGHMLTMRHCTAFPCLMNGCNSEQERDNHPLNLCPMCLRKLVWNLQVEPVPYLKRLEAFCHDHWFDEAYWYGKAVAALQAAGDKSPPGTKPT